MKQWVGLGKFLAGHMQIIVPICVALGVLFPQQIGVLKPNALGGKHDLADVLYLMRVEQRIELGIVADQYTQRDSFRSCTRFSRTSS